MKSKIICIKMPKVIGSILKLLLGKLVIGK